MQSNISKLNDKTPFLENISSLSEWKAAIRKVKQDLSYLVSIDTIPQCKFLQIIRWEWKWITIHQMVINEANWIKNITFAALRDENKIWTNKHIFRFITPAILNNQSLLEPVLKKKTKEYKSQIVSLWDNKLILDDTNEAKKEFEKFINIFQSKLVESVNLMNTWSNNFTTPVIELFRDYTIFKWTVFGKWWVWTSYANNYFSHFIKKEPIEITLDDIIDLWSCKDWLLVEWNYTFITKNKEKILWKFIMLIWKDDKWYHFKTFHSAKR